MDTLPPVSILQNHEQQSILKRVSTGECTARRGGMKTSAARPNFHACIGPSLAFFESLASLAPEP